MAAALKPIIIETAVDLGTQHARNAGIDELIEAPLEAFDRRLLQHVIPGQPIIGSYDGVFFLNRESFGYPNPTLAHFFLAQHLKTLDPRHLVDLGCGVGMLGNYAGVHTGAQEITFADLNPKALQQSLVAYTMNQPQSSLPPIVTVDGEPVLTGKHVLRAFQGDVLGTLVNLRADTAVCAPMFIPGVCEVFPQAYDIFAFAAKRMGAVLYVGHSSLARQHVESAANRMEMQNTIVARTVAPLRIEYSDGTRFPEGHAPRLDDVTTQRLREYGLRTERDGERVVHYHELIVSKFTP